LSSNIPGAEALRPGDTPKHVFAPIRRQKCRSSSNIKIRRIC
jgi:hypothetical protein